MTVSPDGKYIAYTLIENGKRSLWTKHLASNSRVQIVAPANSPFLLPCAFSPDGGYVFYVIQDEQNSQGALFQVPVLGGVAPKKILTDVNAPAALSPDGRQIVFYRFRADTSDDQYLVANADGTNERLLVARREPEWFEGQGASWSPDGKTLALLAYNEQKREQIKLFAFSENGLGAPFKTFDLPVTAQFFYHWSPDGRALVFVNTAGGVSNLWRQPLDGGAPKQFTDFKSERIWNFDYSHDGRQLALARGDSATDAVLISDEGK